MDWQAVGIWLSEQVSALLTLGCALIVIIGFAVIGRSKKRRMRRW